MNLQRNLFDKNLWIVGLAIGVFMAGLMNGASSYLKRVGMIDRADYSLFINTYCDDPARAVGLRAQRCLCMRDPTEAADGEPKLPQQTLLSRRYLYETVGAERALKAAKDILSAALIGASLWLVFRRQNRVTGLASAWPLWILVLAITLGSVASAFLWGGKFAVVGLRSFTFVAVALLGTWLSGGMHWVARSVAALLVVQLVLVASEYAFGIPLRFCPNTFRAAGSLVLPNTLGVFAVAALAFYAAFSLNARFLWWLVAATVVLVLASGSGTGVAALGAWGIWLGIERYGAQWSRAKMIATVFVLAAILLAALPYLVQRPTIYDSVLGREARVGSLVRLVEQATPQQLLFGQGVGFGTNSGMTLLKDAPEALPVTSTGEKFSADSTVTIMFTQLGVIGVLLFYAVLIWAFVRKPKARGFFIVASVTSLAINLPETYPVNFLLGLALATIGAGVASRVLTSEAGSGALVERQRSEPERKTGRIQLDVVKIIEGTTVS